jgi:hypothetical protein
MRGARKMDKKKWVKGDDDKGQLKLSQLSVGGRTFR